MKSRCLAASLRLVVSVAAGLVLAGAAQAQVNVNIFSGFNTSGGGAPFSNLVGSFTSPDIAFGTNTGFNWHPFGRFGFGADLTGSIKVPVTGAYTFGLDSDDGSLFFLNGVQNVDNGGSHAPQIRFGTPVNLTAGIAVPFEVQFYEDGTGSSGLDLLVRGPGIAEAVLVPASFVQVVPEPGSLALMMTGGLPLLGLLRHRRAVV